jgi:hypothetical protein
VLIERRSLERRLVDIVEHASEEPPG